MNLEVFLHLLMVFWLLVFSVVAPLLIENADQGACSLILGWHWEHYWVLLSVITMVCYLIEVNICNFWHLKE